jgi:hypothetical protein
MKFIQSIGLMVLACIFAGCAATQPVKWTTCAPMDLTKGGKVAGGDCGMRNATRRYGVPPRRHSAEGARSSLWRS